MVHLSKPACYLLEEDLRLLDIRPRHVHLAARLEQILMVPIVPGDASDLVLLALRPTLSRQSGAASVAYPRFTRTPEPMACHANPMAWSPCIASHFCVASAHLVVPSQMFTVSDLPRSPSSSPSAVMKGLMKTRSSVMPDMLRLRTAPSSSTGTL